MKGFGESIILKLLNVVIQLVRLRLTGLVESPHSQSHILCHVLNLTEVVWVLI
jgi:hypothetical protein